MYDVPRMHPQSATEQFGALAAMYSLKRAAVPLLPWSSPVMTTTAGSIRGKYQNRGSGFFAAFMLRMMFHRNRCCSSACGIATLLKST